MNRPGNRLLAGSAAVLASMLALFVVPRAYFIPATFVSTTCMVAVSYLLGLRWKRRPGWKGVAAGLGSALVLYAVFYGGNAALRSFLPSAATASNESAIYSLISSPGNPLYLQGTVLLFDSAGFEAFFRGTLQARASGRLGLWAPFSVAALDAAIHLATFNPLWVATTFVADICWGLTYHYTNELTSSFTSHLAWDLAIFIFFPIR